MTNQNNSNKIVHGTVSDGRNNKLANLLVKAFDRDMRSEGLLGECLTDAKGEYSISYTEKQFNWVEKQTADLAVKVYSGGGKILLYETDLEHIVFNASDDETIDVVIFGGIKSEENEFDYIQREISALIGGVGIPQLQDSDEHRDITFLSKETGISAEKLEHFVVAARLNAEFETDAAFFYGLFRKNTLLKNDLGDKFRVRLSIDINSELKPLVYEAALADAEIVRRDLEAAIGEMIVPLGVTEVLEKNLELLRGQAADAEAYYASEYPTKVLDILTRFVLEDRIGEMGRIFQENKNNLPEFFKKITDDSFFKSEPDASSAQTSAALAQLLGFDDAIISQVKESKEIKNPEDEKKLAALNPDDWKRALTDCAGEINIAGRELDESLIDFHAAALARKMENKFPGVAFTAQLEREEKPFLQNHENIRNFLKENDDFDLRNTSIDLFLKEKNLNGDETEAMSGELKAVQRVFKLVPHYGKTNALLQQNIHSAQSIAAIGESRFVREIAPEAGISQKEAKEIYRKAESVNTAAMLVVGELQDTIRTMDVSALQVDSLSNKLAAVGEDFPNLETLFRLTDVCACEHCRSVYSPAAYLVEILQFLDKRSVVDLTVPAPPPPATRPSVNIAKDVLFERRPDLGFIDLGCENANTPIPYIDLVCELLEEVVAPDAGINYTGVLSDGPDPLRGRISNDLFLALTTAPNPISVTRQALIFETETTSGSSAALPHYLRDKEAVCVILHNGGNNYVVKQLRQTLHSAEELAAAPAYVNQNAYDELRNKQYAFKLPFDLNHTEAKAYFSRFGIERHELMSDFQVADIPADEAVAAEHLGLNEAERLLIVTPDPNHQKKYWNTTSTDAASEMKIVDTFLTKSGLTYKELELLLSLKFIDPPESPPINLFIKHNYDDPTAPNPTISCDTTKKEIANLDNVALDRMHRFLRLQKITGWKFSTLDEIIQQPNLGNGTLDDLCLIKASELLKLSELTGIKLEELLGFFDEIPHEESPADDEKPLYHQIFLNKTKNGFIDEGLLPENVDGGELLSAYKTTISVCLQISEQDLDKLLAFIYPEDTLTFSNLSMLYAASKLIRKLKLKMDEFIILIELTGIDITNSPGAALEFVEAAIASKQLPLKPADVKFMLWHEAANITNREIKDAKIEQILVKLQNAYKTAAAANKSPFDENLSADEQKEAVQNLFSKLVGVEEEDVKTFVKFIDLDWTSVPDALDFVEAKLGALFIDVTSINESIIDLGTTLSPHLEPGIESERNALVKAYLDTISEYLFNVEIRNSLQQTIAAAFKSDVDLTNIVLNNARLRQFEPPVSPPVSPPYNPALLSDLLLTDELIEEMGSPPVLPTVDEATFPEQYAAIRLLHKLFPLISSFKLENENVALHLQHNISLGWFLLDGIPYESGQDRIDYSIYTAFAEMLAIGRQLTPLPNPADTENPITFYTLVEMLLDGDTSRDEWIDAFSLLTGYEKQDVDDIDVYLFPVSSPSNWDVSNYNDVEIWKLIEKITGHLRKLGATVAQVEEFIKPVLTHDDVRSLRMTLKARYDDESWLNTLKQITDAIRPQKRDALVAYLLATKPGMKDANDLYNYYLVDVEMESCMPSSRIVQAHGVVQLFVQRCLMGLEPRAAADLSNDSKWNQWKWMKNYRVWEANRKVFLYPENWLEGELRDGKSFLFEELEDQLLQKELNEDAAEEALIKYLEGLDGISFLEIAATWYQTETRTMHVFGRTKGDPPTYYYRTFKEEKAWTPWEKVDVDITGKHVIAYVRRNRLNLAWLVFKEEPDPNPKATIPNNTAGLSVPVDKPSRKLSIRVAISEFTGKEWLPKKISNDSILTPSSYTVRDLPRNDYNLMYLQVSGQLQLLRTSYDGSHEYHEIVGVFNVVGCKGYPELVPQTEEIYLPDFLPDFRDAPLKTQRYTELNKNRGFAPPAGTVNKILIQPDGKILVGGNFRVVVNNVCAGLIRLNADGTFDTGFQPPAFYNASYTDGTINAIALQPDGKILVGGDFQGAGSVAKQGIMRLNANGSIDTTFNATVNSHGIVADLTVQPNGKILIGGVFTSVSGGSRVGVARLNSNGSLDSVVYQNTVAVNKMVRQPDGKLVVGNATSVRRFNSDGNVDHEYSPVTVDGSVLDMHLLADGKILVAGTFTQVNGVNLRGLFRINPGGSIDTTFNSGGAGLGNGGVNGITPTPAGKFLIFGTFSLYNGTTEVRAALIDANGALDTNFNYTGIINPNDMAFLLDGKIMLGGPTSLARIYAFGASDPTFVMPLLDDLSVKNAFFPYEFLELLSKTPGTFNVTYPNQLTSIDVTSILFQYLMRFASGRREGKGLPQIPIGSLLPYFMEDGEHAYVIIPAFYGIVLNRTWHATTSVIRSASDALRLIDDVNALFNKYAAMYNDDRDKNVDALMAKLSEDRDYRNVTAEINVYWNLGYAERFKNMYHPLMCPLRTILYDQGVPAFMTRQTQQMTTAFNFKTHYLPTNRVTLPLPVENIDFSDDGSYSVYNWEMFFHIPFLLATRLSKNQRFEEAMDWFHYIFNPTGALEGAAPQKYWVTKPFFETSTGDYINQRIDTLLYRLADPATAQAELDKLRFAVEQWRDNPFMPYVVAQYRPVAYQKATVMKYLDNLIEWGDYLFRQDTMESIVQATQMYNLAGELLGDRPRTVPHPINAPYENYNQMEAKIDAFGNALIDLENILPDLSVLPEGGAELPPPPITLSMLYFCIPQNDKMLEYWDRVEDRLFKIHNCLNIEGVERSLALFAPPIDPGMLVRAAASGLDISSVIAGINAPTPFYRFNVMSQKASELAQEVRSLGSSLLQAIEKKDTEELSLLRSGFEIKVLNAVRDMKRLQISEAKEQIESLKKTKAVTEERHLYYSTILEIIPEEQENLDKLSKAQNLQTKANFTYALGATLALIPDLTLGASGFGGSPHGAAKFGGSLLAHSTDAIGKGFSMLSGTASYEANRASIQGGHKRRKADWDLQTRLAEKELVQIAKQIAAAEIRKEIAETDLKNHDLQTANAIETDKFMRTKFTNKQLYDWTIGQISSVYFRAYKLAHDFAKKAERCYRFELGNDDTFIDFGYWDSMKKGLQSADRLLHDIKRMETGYLDKYKREYEVTKHVSLAMLDPLALIMLRETGTCIFEMPEAVYDMDHPGHYFRRLKNVSLSLPCIAGPYTSVSAKLSLVSNKYRKNTTKVQGTNDPKVQYEEVIGSDERFIYNIGAIQSIAASNSQNDSGMFELNFRDERYLPFEYCGAISSWRLELPGDVRQFDYDTISDVVLHVKYTAREGGSTLRGLASATLKAKLAEIQQRLGKEGLHIALNMKHDMPSEWHLLKTSAVVETTTIPNVTFSVANLTIDKSRLPYFAQSMNPIIEDVIFLARFNNNPNPPPLYEIKIKDNANAEETITLMPNEWELYEGKDANIIDINEPFKLKVSQTDLDYLDELMMVVKYSF
jgi:uncharacterized delta-60 repeat protein